MSGDCRRADRSWLRERSGLPAINEGILQPEDAGHSVGPHQPTGQAGRCRERRCSVDDFLADLNQRLTLTWPTAGEFIDRLLPREGA